MKRFARSFLGSRTSVQSMSMLLLALWLALVCVVLLRFPSISNDLLPEYRVLAEAEVADQSQIDVGVHVESINGFDSVKNTFKAEEAIWAKWDSRDQLAAGGSPLETLYFSNSINDSSGIDADSSDGIVDLGNGRRYEYSEFSGYFKKQAY